MKTASADRKDFVAYPTNRVVGTVTDAGKAREAIGALLQAGFREQDIDLLHGEEGLHRLDQTGAEHGFLAQFQRTMIRTFETDEFKHLTHHIEDVRAGRCVLMVLTKRREQRIVAGDILHQYGAEFVGFYGRWAWADVPPSHRMTPSDIPAMYVRAWNARDSEALASLFDGDAEFVNGTGVCWRGRDSIRTGHAALLKGAADSSVLAADQTTVKFLVPEVAIVHARMSETGERPTIVSFVVHRVGERWLCASAHKTEVVDEGTNVAAVQHGSAATVQHGSTR